MNKEEQERFNKFFRKAAFAILTVLIVSLPILFAINKVSADKYLDLYAQYGSEADEVKNFEIFNLPMAIYEVNSFLCIISIILLVIYFSVRKYYYFDSQGSFVGRLRNNWPCILLAIFMAWTSVGCIQAGMEMNAEIIVRQAEAEGTLEKVPERITDIANWSPTDRMSNTSSIYQNAQDRAWHGCENLKDGYFSFMFYATVLLNVLMLGKDSEKYKIWIMRILLVTSIILGVLSLIAFYRPIMFSGSHFYFNRALFNNLNHFGYYITVVLAMSVCMWIREKSYYFKGLYLLNSIMYFILLSINNTFGAYIGIFFFMIFLCIVSLIRLISNKEVSSFVQYLVCLIVFVVCSCTIAGAYTDNYTANYKYFSYSRLLLNFGDSTYQLSFNSYDDKTAEESKISEAKINGALINWGTKFTKLENKIDSNVARNVNGLKNDINTLKEFVSNKNKSESKEVMVSGDVLSSGEKIKISQSDFQKLFSEIEEKYPPVSGESLEDFSKRQNAIESETKELLSKYEIIQEKETDNNKSGLSNEVSGIGSGRGETWIKSLDLVNQRPWFGWGLENMLNEFYQQYGIQEGRTHNLVLQLAGTTGIGGVLLYLVATISIFCKCIFDVELRKFSKKHTVVIGVALLVAAIAMWLIMRRITDKLLFIWGAITAVEIVLSLFVFAKKVKLRVSKWNDFEFVSASVFVAYMISSLFGNSTFYTSPLFMIFLGMLTYEVINKGRVVVSEKVPVGFDDGRMNTEEDKKEIEPTKQVSNNNNSNSSNNNNSAKKNYKKNKNKKRG